MNTRKHVVSVVVVLILTAASLVGLLVLNTTPKLGLDLQGGLSVVLTARGEDIDEGVLDETVDIIRNRVDSLGAQEPDISRSGTENIIVQLPGIKDPDRALELIGRTAQLRFREVLGSVGLTDVKAKAVKEDLKEGTEEFDRFVAKELKKQGYELTDDDPADEEVVFTAAEDEIWYKLGPAEVVGKDIATAQAIFDTQGGSGWQVEIDMTSEGTKKWSDLTTRLAAQQKQLAIVLDKRVESAPTVQEAITDGQARITGQFTEGEAKDLALVLKTGALPIELEQSQVQRVSATLGTASLRSGLIAGAIGLALVAVYMVAFYRLLGLITLLGLGIFSAMIMGLIGAISQYRGFSLTLAGIAGLIVSVGVAADSYIIYFERVKDELKEGKTFRSSVERAFRSAFRTNISANSVAFAAAIILYLLAVGPVRGFALTLGISVLFDIALLYFFTHPIVALIARRGRMTGARAIGVREVTAAAGGGGS
jgi:protein-export membrane protein SecD